MITQELIDGAMNYEQYKKLLEGLLQQGKTTGPNQSDEYLNYAKINLQRMHRLEKTVNLGAELSDALRDIKVPYTWLVITEGWCGDASQNLPVLNLIDQGCSNIDLRLLLRDEHPQLIDQYLTNGARAIPKLICLKKDSTTDNTYAEVFVWGPRPAVLQEIVMKLKKENASVAEKGLITQNWYNADKTQSLQEELLKLVRHL